MNLKIVSKRIESRRIISYFCGLLLKMSEKRKKYFGEYALITYIIEF